MRLEASQRPLTEQLQHISKITVFTRISAAALIHFFAPRSVRRLFESGAYLNIVSDQFTFSIFLFNGTLSIC